MVSLIVFIFCVLLILLSLVSEFHFKSLPTSAPHDGYMKVFFLLVLLYTSVIPLDLVKIIHFRPVPISQPPCPSQILHCQGSWITSGGCMYISEAKMTASSQLSQGDCHHLEKPLDLCCLYSMQNAFYCSAVCIDAHMQEN